MPYVVDELERIINPFTTYESLQQKIQATLFDAHITANTLIELYEEIDRFIREKKPKYVEFEENIVDGPVPYTVRPQYYEDDYMPFFFTDVDSMETMAIHVKNQWYVMIRYSLTESIIP